MTPTEGAVLATSHPVFLWTLPPNEESDAVYVANSPATTPNWSNHRNTFQSFYSTPTGFRIRPAATLVSIRTHRYLSLHWFDVTVRWKSNVHTVRTKVGTNIIGYTWSTSFTWHRPRGIRQGTPLTLYASVIVGGVKKTRAVIVRAP